MLPAPRVLPAPLGPVARGWFTGRADRPDPPIGRAGNLSHHRPHVPDVLAADRRAVGDATGTDPGAWHLMDQVHGDGVAVIDGATTVGTESRGVDALVTDVPDRVLGVASADCVPVLLAGRSTVGAVHAGRRGVEVGVLDAACAVLGESVTHAAVGPAIGGCCYEVPAAMQAAVCRVAPRARATTTWGTPSLDLPAAVMAQLSDAGVAVARVGGCTRCGEGWFSHRADPGTGRQFGLVTRG